MVVAVVILLFITLISLILFIVVLYETAKKTNVNLKYVYEAIFDNELLLEDIKRDLENKKKL